MLSCDASPQYRVGTPGVDKLMLHVFLWPVY